VTAAEAKAKKPADAPVLQTASQTALQLELSRALLEVEGLRKRLSEAEAEIGRLRAAAAAAAAPAVVAATQHIFVDVGLDATGHLSTLSDATVILSQKQMSIASNAPSATFMDSAVSAVGGAAILRRALRSGFIAGASGPFSIARMCPVSCAIRCSCAWRQSSSPGRSRWPVPPPPPPLRVFLFDIDDGRFAALHVGDGGGSSMTSNANSNFVSTAYRLRTDGTRLFLLTCSCGAALAASLPCRCQRPS
jgi:hypothetical protein